MKLNARIRHLLRRMRGVVESPSAFCNRRAFWVNGKEIALFDATGRTLQLRLTRSTIRELRADRRVTRRTPSSDWIHVVARAPSDLALVKRLARLAVRAHLPKTGRSKMPPRGADLARRRRFH